MKLRITLQSDLCAGSGTACGVLVDADISYDADGLPTLPARRLKGCLRESATQLARLPASGITPAVIDRLFGTAGRTAGTVQLQDAVLPYAADFAAAKADKPALKEMVTPAAVLAQFSDVRGQTALENGMAKPGSLRNTRVLCAKDAAGEPVVLEAAVTLPEQDVPAFETICAALHHIGLHRTRGLGYVHCALVGGHPAAPAAPDHSAEGKNTLRFAVALAAPLILPDGGTGLSSIPGAAVLGALAGKYLAEGAVDPLFEALFLSGAVRYLPLTPQVGGRRTVPAPLFLVNLKNLHRYANRTLPEFYTVPDPETGKTADKEKRKTLEGWFAAPTADGFALTLPETEHTYHHSVTGDTLYTETALCAGQIFAGEIRAPEALIPPLRKLLQGELRFGRSRTAQYATCKLQGAVETAATAPEPRPFGNLTYVVLESDLICPDEQTGAYATDAAAVRAALGAALGVSPAAVTPQTPRTDDVCSFGTVGGWQGVWGLQKPRRTVVLGGSVFCFDTAAAAQAGKLCPREFTLGDSPQEGFGRCRVYTEADMSRLAHCAPAPVDTVCPPRPAAPCPKVGELMGALLLARAEQAAVLRAQTLGTDNAALRMTPAFVGRMLLMLAESGGDYEKFLNHLRDGKDEKKRGEALAWLKTLLGGERPNPATLLAGAPELLPLFRGEYGEEAAEEALCAKLWQPVVKAALTTRKYAMKGAREA